VNGFVFTQFPCRLQSLAASYSSIA
jgi:hypothetical protein